MQSPTFHLFKLHAQELDDGYLDRTPMLQYILLSCLFPLWGAAASLNDILITQFKTIFTLSNVASAFVQTAFYLGYFLIAIPASLIIKKASYKVAIMIGLSLYTIGCSIFFPASRMATYGFFLIALFALACGLSFLETSANTFSSLMGPKKYSTLRLNISETFYPLGAIAGILLGKYLIFGAGQSLERQMKGRMVLMDASATGEENVLEAKRSGEMNDLQYRRKQLEQLQQEVLDLEDISGGISITDFAFDDFRVELQRYAKEHPGLLEGSSQGLHAVTVIPDDLKSEVQPGVIFCLKQNDESRNPKDTNPTFPYYVVYVTDDGIVRSKHTNPKVALDIMRAVCAGRPEPLYDLCREFNVQTRDGASMNHYSDLLDAAVSEITGVQESKGMESLFSLGEVGNGAGLGFDDYSLVSFVVMR